MPVRAIVAGLLVAGLVLTGAAPLAPEPTAGASTAAPRGPGASSGFYTETDPKGSTDANGHGTAPIAIFPLGMNVYVIKRGHGDHDARIEAAVRTTVADLRRFGLNLIYRGAVTTRAQVHGTDGGLGGFIGVVDGTQNSADIADCNRIARESGSAFTEAFTLTSTRSFGRIRALDIEGIAYCPQNFAVGRTQFLGTTRHEFGHAIGLDHYQGDYRGHRQLMNPVISRFGGYRGGDINGLRYIAYESARVRIDALPVGKVESWAAGNGAVSAIGWAVNGDTSAEPAAELFINGQIVPDAHPDQSDRRDIRAKYRSKLTDLGFTFNRIAVPGRAARFTACIRVVNPLLLNSDPSASRNTRPIANGCKTFGPPLTSPSARTPTAQPSALGTSKALVSNATSNTAKVAFGGLVVAAILFGGAAAGLFTRRRRRHTG
jgi:hypothetical protein